MMSSPHLDQLGHVTSTLMLRGEQIPVASYSLRDRTWGPRGGQHSSSQKPEYQRGEYRVLHPGGPRWREVERQRGVKEFQNALSYELKSEDIERGVRAMPRGRRLPPWLMASRGSAP
ncbi:MAG: hypothetical protein AB7Q42_09730 [Acidimicrobiia bacterium]